MVAVTVSCSDDALPETSVLGPEVDRIPERAYAAVMVAPPMFEFSYNTVQDNSWVVFVDRDMTPLGYMHQKGMFRSQIARYRDGIVFADHERYFVTSKAGTRVEPHDAGGMSLRASTPYDLQTEGAFLWLDDGVVDGQYRTTAISVSSAGSVSIRKIDGRIVSFGRCTGIPYAVFFRSFGSAGSDKVHELVEIDMSKNRPDIPKARGIFDFKGSGGGMPYSCDSSGRVSTYMSDGYGVSEGRPIKSGFWTASVDDGRAEWSPVPREQAERSAEHGGLHTQYQAPFGAKISWPSHDGIRYVDTDGQVSEIRFGQDFASYLFAIAPDIQDRRVHAIAVGSGSNSIAYLERVESDGFILLGDGEFVFTDLNSREENRRIPTPEWLANLVASDPFTVSDIALLDDLM
ncbi:hypothetical protein MUG78_09785 [Gordonia alkaliphila]|nr:hypothetical protein [Gordonia alkaliphila]MCK0439743.1 hypothetical protein [Gordonia alkaliphila]